MAHAKLPTALPNLVPISSTSSSPTSTCLVRLWAVAGMGQEAGDEWPEVADLLFLTPTGSPFTVKVTGEGRMKESITRRRQAPSIATIGSTCDLNLQIPGGRGKSLVGQGCGKAPEPVPGASVLLAYFSPPSPPPARIPQGTGSRWCPPRSA